MPVSRRKNKHSKRSVRRSAKRSVRRSAKRSAKRLRRSKQMKRKILPGKGVTIGKEEASQSDVTRLELEKNKWIAAIEPYVQQLTPEQQRQFQRVSRPFSDDDYDMYLYEQLVSFLKDDIKALQRLKFEIQK
jgi:hypothetical protein